MVEVKVVVAVVLSAFFILSEAAVTVEVISGLSTDNTIECGKQDKIRCVVSPFPGTGGYMAWNTNLKPLTQCFDGPDNDCNSLSVDHYQFTSKPADETFNLTFNTVKLSDGSVEFICTDTITTDSVTPNVTVLPVISSTELVNTSANVIKVTTGCVYPPDDVTFKWMFYAENEDAANAKDYGGSHSVMTEDSSTCTVGDCGGSDVKLRSSTLELENTEKGGSYNFKVVITHAALSETVTKTIGPFELGAKTPGKYVCFWCKKLDKRWKCCFFFFLLILAIVLLIGIIIGIGVEAKYPLWGRLNQRRRILSFFPFFFGFGLFLCDLIRQRCGAHKPGGNENSAGESNAMNTKFSNKHETE